MKANWRKKNSPLEWKKPKFPSLPLRMKFSWDRPPAIVLSTRVPVHCKTPPKPSGSKPPYLGSKLGMKTVAASKACDPGNDPPASPRKKRKKTSDGFPPQYNSIRAARANTATITPLGGIGGVNRTPVRQGIGAAAGFEVEGDTRQYSVQNYHITVKKRNVSATISMPPIGKDDPMGCLSCPTPHSLAESLREGLPIVIFLTDQTFPPVLPPTGDGNCNVIIRVEDSDLWELEEVFLRQIQRLLQTAWVPPLWQSGPGWLHVPSCQKRFEFLRPILVETMTRMWGLA